MEVVNVALLLNITLGLWINDGLDVSGAVKIVLSRLMLLISIAIFEVSLRLWTELQRRISLTASFHFHCFTSIRDIDDA